MEIQLTNSDNGASLNWNTLTNPKNRNKYYLTTPSIQELNNFDNYAYHLKINSRTWILKKDAEEAFNIIVNKIFNSPAVKNVVSKKTVYLAVKQELELEIAARERNSKDKREFEEVLKNIQQFVNTKISNFDFFFAIDGLSLENIEKINCGKVEIFIFNQEIYKHLIDLYNGQIKEHNSDSLKRIENFLDKNFFNSVCIKSTAYGDYDIASKQAYKQARDFINYLRYLLCLLIPDRISEQIIKINLVFEAYSNNENCLVKREKDNNLILSFGIGRKSLENFKIDQKRLQDIYLNGFLNDFNEIINASSQTQLEGCILTAIYWIGEAQNESDLDVAFLKYWTSLECIFTGSEKPTKALAKGVAMININEYIKVEDAKEVYSDIQKLYKKRADIIHRGMNYLTTQVINEADISKICKYTTWSICSLFYLRCSGFSKMDEVRNSIKRLYKIWKV